MTLVKWATPAPKASETPLGTGDSCNRHPQLTSPKPATRGSQVGKSPAEARDAHGAGPAIGRFGTGGSQGATK
ncbi:hypothetical protein GCM10009608_77190 [Pseudonocardia alaniniphila]